jgi:hypothetical protein
MIKILNADPNSEKTKRRLKALEEIRGGVGDPELCQDARCLDWCNIYCGDCNNDSSMYSGNIAYR